MQYFNIAGINLCVNGADFDFFKYRLSKYSVTKPDNIDVFVEFKNDENISFDMPESYVSSKGRNYYETDDSVGFYDYIDAINRNVTFMKADKKWSNITYAYADLTDIFDITPSTAVTNVFGHLFAQALRHHNGVVVHASTIVHNGEAITFTAPSGTGKSTHTGLWKEYYPSETVIINDDMPAIRMIDEKFYAFGTPWSGKTEINENISAPLKAMVFIEQDENCSITEMSPIEAVIRMMREVPVTPFKQQTDLLMDIFNKLFLNVPAYLLKCNISKDAVDTVKNKLFK